MDSNLSVSVVSGNIHISGEKCLGYDPLCLTKDDLVSMIVMIDIWKENQYCKCEKGNTDVSDTVCFVCLKPLKERR